MAPSACRLTLVVAFLLIPGSLVELIHALPLLAFSMPRDAHSEGTTSHRQSDHPLVPSAESPPGDASPTFVSRSTANPAASTPFAAGSEARRDRLHDALSNIGFDPQTMLDDPDFRGSAALRTYNSFILPKSEGALAMAESPQRATVVANSISFLVREHRSHREEWLRNHDKCLEEADVVLSTPRNPLTVVLDNVRSAHNVGNILRAAEAARVEKIVLCGITPGPPDPKVLKTSLGSAEYVPHVHEGSTLATVRELQSRGVSVWGVETTTRSKPLWCVHLKAPLALVFGNELIGIDAEVLRACDGLVSVPMHGMKNSLNVATCASVVMWEALRQWDSADPAMGDSE